MAKHRKSAKKQGGGTTSAKKQGGSSTRKRHTSDNGSDGDSTSSNSSNKEHEALATLARPRKKARRVVEARPIVELSEAEDKEPEVIEVREDGEPDESMAEKSNEVLE